MTTSNGRTADHPIDPLFLNRWSPRSFTGEPIADAELFTILEAARWAPSASNLQPWRFLYAKRETPDWPRFHDLLSPGNQGWAAGTAVLLATVSKRTRKPKEGPDVDNYSASFETGAAWAQLALQASLLGWATHAMGGFDLPRAIDELAVPETYRIECMAAIGRYLAGETPATPNARSPITSFVREGVFAP